LISNHLQILNASRDTCLQIYASSASLHHVQDSPAFETLERARESWADILPGNPDSLWAWCLSQDRDRLLGLMAYCASRTVNAVQTKGDRADSERLLHAHHLGQALRLDMTKWFRPTAGNYFGRITKPGIPAALAEVKGSIAPAWEKAKKSDLAVIAERETTGSGWLPEVLQ
jgi:ParB family chromosome partitioning protein